MSRRRRVALLGLLLVAAVAAGPVAAGDPPPPPVAKASSGAVPPTAPPAAEAAEEDTAAPAEGEPDVETSSQGGEASSLELGGITRVWPAVLDRLHQTAPALAASFDGARPVAVDAAERTVTIGFPPDHTFNKRKAEAKDKREQLTEVLEAILGERLHPAYDVLDGEGSKEPAATEGEAEVDHAALVERLKSEFDAEEVG